MAGASLKAALVVNFLIGLIKLFVGLLTVSSAMISEAIHSFADTFNQILLALGIRRSKQEADSDHPFGYSKVQFFWAFIVAVLIFGISGTLAFRHGWDIVAHGGHDIREDLFIWNIVVLVTAILLESYALWQAYSEAKAYQEKFEAETFVEALDQMQDPVLLSLLVEDTLALVGLTIALIGVVLTHVLHMPVIDGITSMVIGVVLMIGGLLLARENKRYLVGKSVSSRIQVKINNVVENFEGVKHVHSMKTMLLGPKDMLLALDLHFTDEIDEGEIPAHIDKLENAIIKEVPMLGPGKIFVEVQ